METPVEVRYLSNDIYYTVDRKVILTGYNDGFWHNNIKPDAFKKLGIVNRDGRLFQVKEI